MSARRIPWRSGLLALLSALFLALVPGTAVLAQDPLPLDDPAEAALLPPGYVRFTGVIEATPDGSPIGDWTVAGLTIHVTERTRILRYVAPGDVNLVGYWATVQGPRDEGSRDGVTAQLLTILPPTLRLQGPVLSIPEGGLGVWNVAGQRVVVDEHTRFAERAARITVGAWVEVLGREREGRFYAERIIAIRLAAAEVEAARRTVSATGPIVEPTLDHWVLGPMYIHCTRSTQVLGPQRKGLIAQATGTMSADGRFVAGRITVQWQESRPDVGQLVRFQGIINQIPEGRLGPWQIGERTVRVTERTRIDETRGRAEVGALVQVVAWQAPSTSATEPPEALLITVERPAVQEFSGVVQRRPRPPIQIGQWLIGGRQVMVTPLTRFDETVGRAIVGATVTVRGGFVANGLFVAQEIIVTQAAPPATTSE